MKSNHEYQIMKYLSATLCQNVVPQNKFKLSKKINNRNLDGIFRLTLMIYRKNMKKYVSKFMLNNSRNSMTKNRILQHVQKTEHIS